MNDDITNPVTISATKFLIMDAVKQAWHKTKGAKGTIWLAVIISIIINVVLELLNYLTNQNIFTNIISYIITNLLTMGIVLIGTRRALDLPIKYSMIFEAFQLKYGFRLLLTIILFTLVFVIPILLFIIFQVYQEEMGIILTSILYLINLCITIFLMIRLSLTFRVAVMQDVSPWQAIKQSFIATKHHFWRLLGLVALNILILVVSIIPIGIGLIWTVPYFIISWGIVYRNLIAAKQQTSKESI